MRKTYTIPVRIGGVDKTHKITFIDRKNSIESGRPSSFRQWRVAELEKRRIILEE